MSKEFPNLVEKTLKDKMSYTPPKKPLSFSFKINIFMVVILLCIPFILYYLYKVKKTPKQKQKELINTIKYIKANTKKPKFPKHM